MWSDGCVNDPAASLSPWASDDIPVAPAPSAVMWTSSPVGTDPANGSNRSDDGRRRSRQNFALGALVAVAAITVGFATWPHDPNGAVAAPTSDGADAPLNTVDPLPEAFDVESDGILAVAPIGFSPGPPVGPVRLDVVTIGRLNAMTHLDLDGATATQWITPNLSPTEPVQLFSDATNVLAIFGNGDEAFVSQFGRTTALDSDAIPLPPLLPGRLGGTVWARPPNAELDVESMLFTLDGTPVNNGATVTIDRATLLGGDSLGGLVIETGGDVYVTAGGDPGGFTTGLNRLTSGEILAIGAGHAIVRECDTVRNCTTSRLDRATRELTTITGSPVVGSDAVGNERDVPLIGSMSPDGNVVLARIDPGPSADANATETWALYDLASNTQTILKTPARGQPVIWNEDSSYAAFASAGALFMYERSTASIIAVDAATSVSAVTAVGASFSADGDQN